MLQLTTFVSIFFVILHRNYKLIGLHMKIINRALIVLLLVGCTQSNEFDLAMDQADIIMET